MFRKYEKQFSRFGKVILVLTLLLHTPFLFVAQAQNEEQASEQPLTEVYDYDQYDHPITLEELEINENHQYEIIPEEKTPLVENSYDEDEPQEDAPPIDIKEKEIETPEATTYFTVSLNWEGEDGNTSHRPDYFQIELLIKDGYYLVAFTDIFGYLNEANNWTYTFEDLPKYNEDGQLIQWGTTIWEPFVGAYHFFNERVSNTLLIYTAQFRLNETTSHFIQINWEGDEHFLHRRPNEVTLLLYAYIWVDNGDVWEWKLLDQFDQEIVLSAHNNWQATITDLPRFVPTGEDIVWEVVELDLPYWYDAFYDEGRGFSHITAVFDFDYLPTTDVSVEVIWQDDSPQNRPAYIQVQLQMIHPEFVDDIGLIQDITAETNWQMNFPDLPLYFEDGHLVEWNLIQVNIDDNYEVTTERYGNHFTLINAWIQPNPPVNESPQTPERLPETGMTATSWTLLGLIPLASGGFLAYKKNKG